MPFVLLAAIGLGLLHLTVGTVNLRVLPREYWRSGAGGIAVAYVFVHLLPELGERQTTVDEYAGFGAATLESALYVIALAGFVAFYGVEQIARTGTDSDHERSHDRSFWLHVGSF